MASSACRHADLSGNEINWNLTPINPILDAIFKQDPKSRVAAETLCNTGLVLLAGAALPDARAPDQWGLRDLGL
jgi:hypothetical protein